MEPNQNQNNKSGGTVGIVIIVLVILAGGIYLFVSKAKVSPTPNTGTVPEVNTTSGNLVSKIKIPLLVDQGDAAYENQGKPAGCDRVIMVEKAITPTSAPLTSAMNELFKRKDIWPPTGTPGNFITSQTNLNFQKATIENGVANIYLTGSYTLSGVCDDPRLKTVLEETALQFPTVRSVKFYLNDKEVSLIFSEKGE